MTPEQAINSVFADAIEAKNSRIAELEEALREAWQFVALYGTLPADKLSWRIDPFKTALGLTLAFSHDQDPSWSIPSITD